MTGVKDAKFPPQKSPVENPANNTDEEIAMEEEQANLPDERAEIKGFGKEEEAVKAVKEEPN